MERDYKVTTDDGGEYIARVKKDGDDFTVTTISTTDHEPANDISDDAAEEVEAEAIELAEADDEWEDESEAEAEVEESKGGEGETEVA